MALVRAHVLVCTGTGCVASGSRQVIAKLNEELKAQGLDKEVKVVETGCQGFCEQGPLVIIYPEGTFYTHVHEEDVKEIVSEHLVKGRVVSRLLFKEPLTAQRVPDYADIDFYKKQHRLVLKNCGHINPDSLEEYIGADGYEGLAKVLLTMTPEQVVEEMKKTGLRGRGGGGFPTGMKWGFCQKSPGPKKYIICNADEGDPGAFMDRSVLEGDPHSVLEGMCIGGYAIGADEAYIYCRAEYPLAIHRLEVAIKQAEEIGLLGNNILGSGFKGRGSFLSYSAISEDASFVISTRTGPFLPLSAILNASLKVSARSSTWFTKKLCLVMDMVMPVMHTSWNASLPMRWSGTLDVMATMGMLSM